MTIGSLSGGTIGIHNYQHDYLITNLHLHGLHISGEAKSDNIFVMVRSGRSFGYEYMIPPDHMGGTHWCDPSLSLVHITHRALEIKQSCARSCLLRVAASLITSGGGRCLCRRYHPHWHGATGIQSGGGAVGMLVVEDAPGTLPSFLENTAGLTDKELELFILGMDLDNVRSISDGYLNCCKGYHNASIPFVDLKAAGYCQAKFGGDQPHLNPEKRANDLSKMADKNMSTALAMQECTATAFFATNDASATGNLFLVNGLYNPEVSIEAGRWTRVRIVYAAISHQIYFGLPDECEMKLLAKDGVYLPLAPRNVSFAFLGPGNRADLLVRCSEGLHEAQAWFYAYWMADADAATSTCDAIHDLPADATRSEVFEAMTKNSGSGTMQDPVLPLVKIRATAPTGVGVGRSCELPKFNVARPCYLVDLQEAPSDGVERPIFFGYDGDIGATNTINGQFYENLPHPGPELYDEPVGTVPGFVFKGLHSHAMHWHINPYQLQLSYDEFGGVGGVRSTVPFRQEYEARPPLKSERGTPADPRPIIRQLPGRSAGVLSKGGLARLAAAAAQVVRRQAGN